MVSPSNAATIPAMTTANPIFDPSSGRKTPTQGAATSVWCATSPQLNDLGAYRENVDIADVVSAEDVRDW